MANLFELLSKEDCEKIEGYIRNFAGLGGDSSDMKASLDYILRFGLIISRIFTRCWEIILSFLVR